jgi:hypothetical protein
MYTVSRKNESKDFQTPEAVIEEWEIRTPDADTVKKWEAALVPYGDTTGIPEWWWGLKYQPVLEETISVPQWTKNVENDLEQIRKGKKLRRGTKAYEDFLIKALPRVVYPLRELINKDMKETVDANEAEANKWLEKAAVAERKLDESIEQVQKAAATRAAFARFYGVSASMPSVGAYETLLSILTNEEMLLRVLINERVGVVRQRALNDELTWNTTRKALQAVPEIREVWYKVQWPAEVGPRYVIVSTSASVILGGKTEGHPNAVRVDLAEYLNNPALFEGVVDWTNNREVALKRWEQAKRQAKDWGLPAASFGIHDIHRPE